MSTQTPQFEQESVVIMKTPIAILVSLLSLTAQAAQSDADLVHTIYEQSSFQGGLVVELGFVNAQFTASLGGRDAVTLHTLDTDPQRVAGGRKCTRVSRSVRQDHTRTIRWQKAALRGQPGESTGLA